MIMSGWCLFTVVVDSLVIVAHIVRGGTVFGSCFVLQYVASFQFCNQWGGEICLLSFKCLHDVL